MQRAAYTSFMLCTDTPSGVVESSEARSAAVPRGERVRVSVVSERARLWAVAREPYAA